MKYVALICLPMFVTACSTTNVVQDIKPSGDVTFSTIESTYPVAKYLDGDLKIKVRASKTSKLLGQSLAPGKEIEVGSQTIYGPTKVSLDTELTFLSIGMGYETRLFDMGLDNWTGIFYWGISQADINLTLGNQGSSYDLDKTNTELFAQFGFSYKATSSLNFEAFYQFGSGGLVCCYYDDSELRLRYQLLKHLEVLAGYRWLNYEYFKPTSYSDLKIDFWGPFAGINIPF